MHLRVAPDDIAAAGARLADDAPSLRGLAALLASLRQEAAAGMGGTGRLTGAADTFLDIGAVALATLAEAADLLAGGFARAAGAYRAAEETAAHALGGARG